MDRNGKFFRSSDVTPKNNGWKMEHQNFISSSCTVLYNVKDGGGVNIKRTFYGKIVHGGEKTIEW